MYFVNLERLEAYQQIVSSPDYQPRYKMIHPVGTEEEKAWKMMRAMIASKVSQIIRDSDES
tara:strand:+ start:1058 stop:1240 length:183 start_codon:yes stop_codon:yes gene_type:complete